MKGERKASTRSRNAEGGWRRGGRAFRGGGGGREMPGKEEEECKSSQGRRKESDNSLSLRPFAHRHCGLTRVSPVSHPVFPVLLPPFGDGERVVKGGRTAGVRERATPRMTQVPQSLTRLRLFCHLLLSFELFYRYLVRFPPFLPLPFALFPPPPPDILVPCALPAPRAGRVDGVSRATSRTFFKIAPPRERTAFCESHPWKGPPRGVDGRSWRISFFEGDFSVADYSQRADLRFPRWGDALIDLSVSATNSKTNVSSPSFFAKGYLRYGFDECWNIYSQRESTQNLIYYVNLSLLQDILIKY